MRVIVARVQFKSENRKLATKAQTNSMMVNRTSISQFQEGGNYPPHVEHALAFYEAGKIDEAIQALDEHTAKFDLLLEQLRRIRDQSEGK